MVNLSKRATPESISALKVSVLSSRASWTNPEVIRVPASGRWPILSWTRTWRTQPMLRQELHRRGNQERVLVDLVRAYGLLGYTYLLFTLDSRDPSASWVRGKAELGVTSGRESIDVPVLAAERDLQAIAPNERGGWC